MKVAIYARVSDDKKKEDGTRRQDVERQVEKITSFLKNRGMTEFRVYKDDGKSAYTEDFNHRTQFKQLLNDCRRGYVKQIYIEDMTRFSRNLSLGLSWMKELSELGVELISLSEGELEATSSGGFLKSGVFLLIAEWNSRLHSEKVKSGMQKARNLGKKIGGFKGKKKEGRGTKTPPSPLKSKENKSVDGLT